MSFALTTDALRDVALAAIERARRGGADQAEAEATQGKGLNVTVRQGELETLEHNVEKSLGVTVYVGGRKGNATSGDFSPQAIATAVDKAITIARHTSADPFAGLADAAQMAREVPDLDLYHPWSLDADRAIAIAQRCEAAGFAVDARIDNSEGASVSSNDNEFVYANTHGFCGGYRGSSHYIGCAMVASEGEAMERDDWYTAARVAEAMEDAAAVGRRAGERAVARLGSRKIATQNAPVLFSPTMAAGFLGHGISALYGGSRSSRRWWTSSMIRSSIAPTPVRRSIPRVWPASAARSSSAASCVATSCPPIPRENSACARPATPAAITIWWSRPLSPADSMRSHGRWGAV